MSQAPSDAEAANEKENPSQLVLASLFGYYSKILKYQFLTDKSKFAAAQALGVNPFFVDGYAKAAANYTSLKLKNISFGVVLQSS